MGRRKESSITGVDFHLFPKGVAIGLAVMVTVAMATWALLYPRLGRVLSILVLSIVIINGKTS